MKKVINKNNICILLILLLIGLINNNIINAQDECYTGSGCTAWQSSSYTDSTDENPGCYIQFFIQTRYCPLTGETQVKMEGFSFSPEDEDCEDLLYELIPGYDEEDYTLDWEVLLEYQELHM